MNNNVLLYNLVHFGTCVSKCPRLKLKLNIVEQMLHNMLICSNILLIYYIYYICYIINIKYILQLAYFGINVPMLYVLNV